MKRVAAHPVTWRNLLGSELLGCYVGKPPVFPSPAIHLSVPYNSIAATLHLSIVSLSFRVMSEVSLFLHSTCYDAAVVKHSLNASLVGQQV